ncbi:pentapeptide repeat-containing protein [Myxococcota bacterium]|nr:pentapeptide repeat-containing protein [Myxococcota bacterium]
MNLFGKGEPMKRFNTFAVASMVFALTVMSGGVASAASYQRTDGTIVDPILDLDGNVSSYSGPNFGPGQTNFDNGHSLLDLTEVDLSGAIFSNSTNGGIVFFNNVILSRARFSQSQGSVGFGGGVDATFARFDFADLQGLDFIALGEVNNFSGASFRGANLNGTQFIYIPGTTTEPVVDLSGADFSDAILTNATLGADLYIGSPLYNANTDFTGTTTNGGQPFDPVAAGWTLVPIPEPNSAILIGIGLSALAVRRENR